MCLNESTNYARFCWAYCNRRSLSFSLFLSFGFFAPCNLRPKQLTVMLTCILSAGSNRMNSSSAQHTASAQILASVTKLQNDRLFNTPKRHIANGNFQQHPAKLVRSQFNSVFIQVFEQSLAYSSAG